MHDGPVPQVLGTTIPVIANARSGGGHADESLEGLRKAFADQGIAAELHTPRAEALEETLRKALEQKPPLVVAAGGDGTVSSVAHALRGTGVALAVIPFGTFNHFAKDLGIPMDTAEAVRVLLDGRRVSIDVGDVNGRTFVNNASLGLYPGMVRTRDKLRRRFGHSKRRAMLWALLAALRRSPLLTLELQADREVQPCRSPFVFIGNNAYAMEGFDIGTRERLDGGRLSIYTAQRCTLGGLVSLAFRALFGRLHQAEDFAAIEARRLRVETPHSRLLVATDGELNIMDTPLEFRIMPGALDVLVPQAKETS
jgi:diacylglycerol kinase family enzyme